jgi:5-hydroxyisourate hydrolase-like protein (transthyretin family)
MKAVAVLLALALAIAAASAVSVAGLNTVNVTVIGSNDQPIKDMTLYLVKDGENTARAVAQNRTNANGRTVLKADVTTDGTYWVVGKGPVVYKDVSLSSAGGTLSVAFMLNDTAAYYNVTFLGFANSLPDSAVRGNLTLRTGAGSVKAVDVSLTLNIAYFPRVPGAGATLEVPRTFSKLATTYTLVNITVHFRNDTRAAYNVTTYAIDPVTVKGIVIFYKSTGAAFLGLPLTAWIAIGILLAASGGLIAVTRSRRAAMAVMRERRALRSADRFVLENGIDWQSLVNGETTIDEKIRRARRALRRA